MVSKKNLTIVKLKTFCNCQNIFSTYFSGGGFQRQYANEGFILFSLTKFNNSVGKCEQSEVSSDSNIFTCMILRTALANENIACDGRLAAVNFYTKAFTLRVTSILYTAFTFFVCHTIGI